MKRAPPIFCVILFLAPAVFAETPKIKKEKMESRGKNHTYYLLVPDNATPEQPAPLLMLNKNGFNAQLTEMKGHDHWYYDLAPKINADAWNFLKQQKPADEPRYTQYSFK